MARTAKCRICGKVLDTSVAYKIAGKPNKYFCNREEYETEEERKKKAAEDKDKVYRLICRIIGRETIINTSLWAEWKIWSSVADDAKIGQFLTENEEYLTDMIGKLDNAEFPRIRYLSTVLKNRLGDYKVGRVLEVTTPSRGLRAQSGIMIDDAFELFEPTLNQPTATEGQILEDVEDDLL